VQSPPALCIKTCNTSNGAQTCSDSASSTPVTRPSRPPRRPPYQPEAGESTMKVL
jgi:hypothetical protein